MELIILFALVALTIFLLKDLKSVVYVVGIFDILLRLIHFIKIQLNINEFTFFINKYLPGSVLAIMDKYASGLLYDILVWAFIAVMVLFVFYLIKYLIKRK